MSNLFKLYQGTFGQIKKDQSIRPRTNNLSNKIVKEQRKLVFIIYFTF